MRNIFFSVLTGLLCCFSASAQSFQLPSEQKAPGEIRVLCIGNSFTYVHDADVILGEIARSQGVTLGIGKFLAPGYTFGDHLENEESRKAVDFGGYDFVFLQDQSSNPARYARDGDRQVLEDFKTLKKNVMKSSPGCKVFLERTWGYGGFEAAGFGTKENLSEYLGKGTRKMARKAGKVKVSPIGVAFAKAEALRPDIKLLGDDEHHQSLEGAYLKACVNYLMITRRPFNGDPAACGVAPEHAAFLRTVAESTVL